MLSTEGGLTTIIPDFMVACVGVIVQSKLVYSNLSGREEVAFITPAPELRDAGGGIVLSTCYDYWRFGMRAGLLINARKVCCSCFS